MRSEGRNITRLQWVKLLPFYPKLTSPRPLDTPPSLHFADGLADFDNQVSVGAGLAEAASAHHVIRGADATDDGLPDAAVASQLRTSGN